MLSIGHLVTDINQGALPALLPFFIAAYGLSYTAAAGIVFALNMASTVIQPLFGYAADRFSKPWFLPVGLMLAGAGLALTGITSDYGHIFLLAIVSGIGVAAYHPEAARLVHFLAESRKATAMSIFGIGGTLGFAVGPVLATTAVLHWGLRGTLILLAPVGIVALVMATQLSKITASGYCLPSAKATSEIGLQQEAWGPFLRLTATIVGRAVVFFGLNTFIPLYWVDVLHQSKAAGAMALAVFAFSGIAGNLLGGNLADRAGHKKIILLGFFSLAFFFPLLLWVDSAAAALIVLVPTGLTIMGTYSPTIVLGQKYLPNRIGLSSGVTIGIAIAIGGSAAPLIGKIADLYGVRFALASIAFVPFFTAAMAMTLPEPEKIRDYLERRRGALRI